MKLNAKGRYAVTAMLDLVLHDGDRPVCVADIAARQGISRTYLEQLFACLRNHGLVMSTRGPGGGYKLARKGDAIMVADVIAAIDESIGVTQCGGGANCRADRLCLTHSLWEELSSQVKFFLSTVSLADVAAWPRVREVAARQDGRYQKIDFHIAAAGAHDETIALQAKDS